MMSCWNNGIVETALNSLGKGFDLTSDFRLKYCKGKERLILLNEREKKEIAVPGLGAFDNVSVDIKCDKGDRTRYQSDIIDFNQMAEFFNRKCGVGGKIPSGEFNSMFGFQSGSWGKDAAKTKGLGLDGYFITLFNLHIDRYPLLLSHQVLNDVPSAWDPPALARFIEKYGTHVIVGLSIGGQDVVLVRQHKSSHLQPSQLKKHLDDLGDQLFTGTCSFKPNAKDQKLKVPQAFNIFDQLPLAFNSYPSINAKDVGEVTQKLTAIVSGFQQLPEGPMPSTLTSFPLLLCLKLYQARVSCRMPSTYTFDVIVGMRPVTGMRLYLEGMKCNRLAIHLQYLSNLPKTFENKMDDVRYWNASEDRADTVRFFEAIHRKNFSHVCTAPVKYNPKWAAAAAVKDVVFIVTGAQLHVKKHDSKSVLHLRLVFSKVSDSFIVQSSWAQAESGLSQKSGLLSAISQSLTGNALKEKEEVAVVVDSAVYPTGPPVPVQTPKLLKRVETSQLCRGPQDSPGYWLVTGARLQMEKGKISLHVKFSLINICSAKT
ncbi:putative S-adenosyl-L-methionine-dependent methyltransferases superfamily protein [Hibiscus syriacus]|uniref:S-adenosyl-L-methionine-dependent methyltransferases superfamily protein n=1 Tax=Hibiscus syriacus TaxID=106335 RepID=A0A6A3BT10_HIBSY|nr:putative S-adenosyl-L-methionine-dependent methyltransferases superfamily protein [Hibiscus syriacus]